MLPENRGMSNFNCLEVEKGQIVKIQNFVTMKITISENLKLASIFTFGLMLAVAFTVCSLSFIVDNYGGNTQNNLVIEKESVTALQDYNISALQYYSII